LLRRCTPRNDDNTNKIESGTIIIIEMWLKKAARWAGRAIDQVSEKGGLVGFIGVLFLMGLTVADVFLRFFFGGHIGVTAEFTRYTMVLVGFLTLAWCASKGMHIKAGLIVDKLSPRAQAIFSILNCLVVIGVSVVIGWRAIVESVASQQLGEASSLTHIPAYPFYLVVSLGFVMLLFVTVGVLVKSIAKVVKR